MPWLADDGLTTCGELVKGSGKVIVAAAPGFSWGTHGTVANSGQPLTNLRDFTDNVLQYITYPFVNAKILLVGSASSVSGLSTDEQAAYNWALTQYGADAAYVSFANIATNGISNQAEVVWYHLQSQTSVPADANSVAANIEAFVTAGGGIFTSGHASQYLDTLHISATAVAEVLNNNTATADAAWGFRPFGAQTSHPIFNGLPASTWPNGAWSGFRTVTQGTQTPESISWWNANTFAATGGTGLAGLPWAGDDITVCGEFAKGTGKAIFASAPGFSWGAWGTANTGQPLTNLHTFTQNIIGYVTPSALPAVDADILLVGNATDTAGLSTDEKAAYDWAMANFDAKYVSFDNLKQNGISSQAKVIWYHLQSQTSVPAEADSVAGIIEAFVNNGGGLFVSGHASQFLQTTNISATAVGEVLNNNTATADAAWGFRPFGAQTTHPIFNGLPASTWPNGGWSGFRTVTQGTQTPESISWWNANSFAATGGTGLAGLPWAGDDITVCGEFAKGSGKAVFASAPGFSWGAWGTANTGQPLMNLHAFTKNILNYVNPNIQPVDAKILLVGSATDTSGLSNDEKTAYDWAMSEYGVYAKYTSFTALDLYGISSNTDVIWYHLQSQTSIPADAMMMAAEVDSFVTNGGGLFVSGFASHYLDTTNISATPPAETISNTAATADPAWGFRPFAATASHPIFAGLPASTWPNGGWSGFRTVAQGTQTYETIAWWNANSFNNTGGTKLAGLPWAGDDITICGEFTKGTGHAIFASAPGFAWGAWGATSNTGQPLANLHLFTKNIIDYMLPTPAAVDARILLVGSAYDTLGLMDGERDAYNWAMTQYGNDAQYVSWNNLATNGISDSARVIWYHYQNTTLPADALAVANDVAAYVADGKGLLLTAHAAQYVDTTNLSNAPVAEVLNNPTATADPAWGFRPFAATASHPIFTGLPASTWPNGGWSGFRTVAQGTQTQENISWWNANSFNNTGGTKLAGLPWAGDDITVCGEFTSGNGHALFASAPGFAWGSYGTANSGTPRANLELFTKNMIDYATPAPLAAMAMVIDTVDCNGAATGSATVTFTGGVMPYTINWGCECQQPSG